MLWRRTGGGASVFVTGARGSMSRHSCSLLSLLFLLLLPRPSLFYFYLKISCDNNNNTVECSCRGLNNIPPEIPKSATAVRVTDSHIQSIKQTALTGLYKLETLELTHCNISHIEDGAFSDLSALTMLQLSKNQLTLLTDNMFNGLSNLSSLSLKTNKITSISKSAFKPLNKLHTLDLSSNYLVQYSDIAHIYLHCPSLETLYLGFNKFTSFESYILPLPVLKTLSLQGNNLTLFETENSPFLFLTLRELDLGSTPLRQLRVHSDVFPHLKSLSLTNVSASVIEWDISDKYFFRSLTSLNLSHTSFTIETYQLLFQMVDSVYSLKLKNIGTFLFDKGLLDFACSIPSLTMLDLSFNNIAVLNDSLLQSCTNLKRVDLSYNSITDFTDASLQMLTQLITLNLDGNQLSRIPAAIRNLATLKYLFLDANHISELQCSDLTHLSLLTELSLRNNDISKLDSCVFRTLTNLNILDVGKNHLVQLDGTFDGTLHKLKGLDVSGNNIVWLHKGTFRNMSSLTFLNLQSIGVTLIEDGVFEGLYNLTHLYLSANSLQGDTLAGLPQLRHLSVAFHCLTTCQHSTTKSFFRLPSLKYLKVTVVGNLCVDFASDVFKGLDNLKTLNSKNVFIIAPDKDTFLYTPHLEKLYIADSLEFDPTPELFHPLTELKTLQLTENKLESLDFLSKANLTKLERLIIINNDLTVINETVFEALPSLKYLDLTGNPFVCDCSNAGFIDWVIRNKQVLVSSALQYRCSSPPSENGHFLLDFNVQSCWEFTGFLCFISSSALVLVTLLSSFTYHFLRWQLVYGYYLLLAFLYDSKKRRQGCPHIYDAFVSYNVHDEDWVYRELLPELEGVQGWRLCLHHRDFQPGKPIIENITDAIYSSRKTLCVISRCYLQSEWCSREIQMASYRLFDEQKDVLILLFLEEISASQLSPFYRMRKLVKSRTYLSWTQAWSHKGLFWENVRRALECGNEPADVHNPLTANV